MVYKSLKLIVSTAGVLLLLYHAVAISIVGPFYDSEFKRFLYPWFQGYLKLTHLDGGWSFYAPDPPKGSYLFYETKAKDGTTSTYPLTLAHGKFEHEYFRYTSIYYYLFDSYEKNKRRGYHESAARFLCKRHAKEEISGINFVLMHQLTFTHLDYSAGKRPLDREFLEEARFDGFICKS